jgi:hypothetical protein
MPIANGISNPLLWDVRMAERLTEEQVSQARHEQLNVDKVPYSRMFQSLREVDCGETSSVPQ